MTSARENQPLALSFLHTPMNSRWKGRCSFYANSLKPATVRNNNNESARKKGEFQFFKNFFNLNSLMQCTALIKELGCAHI